MKKGDIIEGIVERVEYLNRGLVFLEDQAVTVKNVIPGQKISARIIRKRSGKMEAILQEVLEPSPLEKRKPACSLFPSCGGCLYQTMEYTDQLAMKEKQIRHLLGQFMEEEAWEGILPGPSEWEYRNKMEFSFGNARKEGPMTLGLHRRASTYDVLDVVDCAIVHPDMNQIVAAVREYFQEKEAPYYHRITHEGYLRHLLIRRSVTTGETLVHLVTTSQKSYDLAALVSRLLALPLEGKIVGILHLVNDSLADVVQADEIRILWGRDYFYETLMGLRFRISTFSFFQPNSLAAEVLYGKVREYALLAGGWMEEDKQIDSSASSNLTSAGKKRVLYDLYSGTGTITQMLAPVVDEAVGVEIVEEAVAAARENARQNGLEHCRFIAGDVLKTLDSLTEIPDLLILDPPRDGIHPKALPKIVGYGAKAVIYISCKASSLARDLPAFLAAGYRVTRACCVDQFAQGCHVETIVLMSRDT